MNVEQLTRSAVSFFFAETDWFDHIKVEHAKAQIAPLVSSLLEVEDSAWRSRIMLYLADLPQFGGTTVAELKQHADAAMSGITKLPHARTEFFDDKTATENTSGYVEPVEPQPALEPEPAPPPAPEPPMSAQPETTLPPLEAAAQRPEPPQPERAGATAQQPTPPAPAEMAEQPVDPQPAPPPQPVDGEVLPPPPGVENNVFG